jgi:phage gp36-like protein
MPGAAVQYAQVGDLQDRVTQHDLQDLSDEDGAQVNKTKLNAALLDASREIDGSLQSRYQLPLTEVPDILIRICCDIALYRLQGLRPLQNLEDVRKRYDDARADLKLIRSGDMALGVEPVTSLQPAIQQPTTQLDSSRLGRIFSRDKLRNY